ncbi:hypothetical protein HQ585_07300 [candidate division KSB1 bacterium]|nr:hypothetical protein [candidate division KSB1 bacterium]
MKTFRFGFFIALAILSILFCERNKSVPQAPSSPQNTELSYIAFQDNGCANEAAKTLGFFDLPRLLRHTLEDDTLILTFYFWANCCPVFQDSVAMESDSVEIFLTELEEGCWCTCPFENDFQFRLTQGDQVHILFTAETSCYPDGPVTVDTTIVFQ